MDKMKKQKADFKKLTVKNLLWIVLILEITIGYLINPSLLAPMNIQVILFACTLNGIISIGQSLVLISKEIDLTVGANMIFAPIAAIYTTDFISRFFGGTGILQGTTGYMFGGWSVVVVMTIFYGAFIGFLNGIVVAKMKVPAFIATIGMQFFLKGMTYVITKGVPIFFQNLPAAHFVGNASVGGIVPVSVLLFVALGIFIIFLCSKTAFGMRIYATGGGLKAAKLSGINTERWKIIAYTCCGALVGVASVMYMSRAQGIEITQSKGYDMNSIAISIIGGISLSGGKGSIKGSMQATVIIAVLLNCLNLQGYMQYYQTAITGLVIVFIAIIHKRNESKRLKKLKIIEV